MTSRKTATVPMTEPDERQRLCLLVAAAGHVARHPLPERGSVTIGRESACDVAIDDPSISRNHARLHIGAELAIEDLGSSNGTRVRDQRLAPNARATIVQGEPVQIGGVTIIVQRGPARGVPRQIWTHGYFEGRVDEACARAERSQVPFAIVRIHCPDAGTRAAVGELLLENLSPLDLLASFAPGEYEMVLPDAVPEVAEATVSRLRARFAQGDLRVAFGVAQWPGDGRNVYRLLAHADAVARGLDPHALPSGGPIVADPKLHELWQLAARVAASDVSVLLVGDTGVGKERFAEAIHAGSARAARPLLRLHCAALAENMIESELFGHEKGAFTGAVATKPGLLETADGGTVFLDEIGELTPALQVKLLRVLEDRKVLRVGGLEPRSIDVRFVAATNRDLEAEAARGRFRQDLYFRLCGFTLHIPPLRERRAEIEPLAATFMAAACARSTRAVPRLSAAAAEWLHNHPWPGNIRELKNVVERAVLLCEGDEILVEHLPGARAEPAAPDAGPSALGDEPRRIAEALAVCGGNQTVAAKMLGMSRRTLVHRLNHYGFPRPKKR